MYTIYSMQCIHSIHWVYKRPAGKPSDRPAAARPARAKGFFTGGTSRLSGLCLNVSR